jgi:hypothetical protein
MLALPAQEALTKKLIALSKRDLRGMVECAKEVQVQHFAVEYKEKIYEALPYHLGQSCIFKKKKKLSIAMTSLLDLPYLEPNDWDIADLIYEKDWTAINASWDAWSHKWSIRRKYRLTKCAKHLKKRIRQSLFYTGVLSYKEDRTTLLHQAASLKQLESYLRRGANPYVLDDYNRTPMEVFFEKYPKKQAEIKRMFTKYLRLHSTNQRPAAPFTTRVASFIDILIKL